MGPKKTYDRPNGTLVPGGLHTPVVKHWVKASTSVKGT